MKAKELTEKLDRLKQNYYGYLYDCRNIAWRCELLYSEESDNSHSLSYGEISFLTNALQLLAHKYDCLFMEWKEEGFLDEDISSSEYAKLYERTIIELDEEKEYYNTNPDELDDTTKEINSIVEDAIELLNAYDEDKEEFSALMEIYEYIENDYTDDEITIISDYVRFLMQTYYHL